MIKELKRLIEENNIDGLIIPKNDHYFTEYSYQNNLFKISKFSGSAGFAIILKKNNYLFVDGRYVLQAKNQSGKNFFIREVPNILPKDLPKIKGKKIGFDPKLFTSNTLKKYFEYNSKLVPIKIKFNNKFKKKINKIYYLNDKITGESFIQKIKKVKKFLNQKKINYLYISAGENINWLLNIRGKDLPNSPLVNCKLILTDKGKIFFFTNLKKVDNSIRKYLKNIIFCNEEDFIQTIINLKKGRFCIDKNTCSVFDEQIIKSKFNITSITDPLYFFKSIKNRTEINNTIKVHIEDGVALTKFLYWFKNNTKPISEKQIEKKLENFRKRSKNYLFPSFETIAGSGPNGAIIHYKSSKITNRILKKKDVLLIDSGGQYKWGTTDVTRTTFSGKISNNIKNNYTRVLKGHIAVVECDLKKNQYGYLIDKLARKYLKKVGLDYSHGTGHGVGFFLNVHEGPHSISKFNKIKIEKGIIISNEPGFYKKNNYGIRIENLIYVEELQNKLFFKNLTLAPLDLDMVNFKMLTKKEKDYLFTYHLEVYSKISKYLNNKEKKWLVSLIK